MVIEHHPEQHRRPPEEPCCIPGVGLAWWVLEPPFRLPSRHACLHPGSFVCARASLGVWGRKGSGEQHSWKARLGTLPFGVRRGHPQSGLETWPLPSWRLCSNGSSHGQEQERASKYPWLAVWPPCRLKSYKPGSGELCGMFLNYFRQEQPSSGALHEQDTLERLRFGDPEIARWPIPSKLNGEWYDRARLTN